MNLSDFDFDLPRDLIAQHPPPRRGESRLMVLSAGETAQDRRFADLPDILHPDDVIVLNDTRVIPARLFLRKATGGRIGALLVRPLPDGAWDVMLDSSRSLAPGDRLTIDGGPGVRLTDRTGPGRWSVRLEGEARDLMARFGHIPLPPYLRREDRPEDHDRYQTVYAAEEGAIAAPTAGLHFTSSMLEGLERRHPVVRLTLHVGPGTFVPVKVGDIGKHAMEAERYRIPPETVRTLGGALAGGRRIVAVGTTTCRTLETWIRTGASEGWSDLFIRPGFDFRAVGALLTNLHTPRSTLLMLVCAFAGRERILDAYREAVRARYRFYSYGDAMLITR